MNGDVSCSPSQSDTLEETLQQMNILIQENRDLKGKNSCVVRGVGSGLRRQLSISDFNLLLQQHLTAQNSVQVILNTLIRTGQAVLGQRSVDVMFLTGSHQGGVSVLWCYRAPGALYGDGKRIGPKMHNNCGKGHNSNDLVSRMCIYSNSLSVSRPEALRQTNMTMKERFEGLSAWREKQREERDFLESRLEEARGRMEALTRQNQELSRRLEEAGRAGEASGGWQVRVDQSS